ncbi:MAG: ATP-binding cassette domain-containing protein, partial [Pseudobdellovibrionaceae bacterium]
MSLEIHHLKKHFYSRLILNDFNLKLEDGKIGVILGESGSGKTTLLRCLSGLEKFDDGNIMIHNQKISNEIPPSQRQIGFLFQNLGLFPHFNTAQNIASALQNLNSKDRDFAIDQVLNLCEIIHVKEKFPHELSGG